MQRRCDERRRLTHLVRDRQEQSGVLLRLRPEKGRRRTCRVFAGHLEGDDLLCRSELAEQRLVCLPGIQVLLVDRTKDMSLRSWPHEGGRRGSGGWLRRD